MTPNARRGRVSRRMRHVTARAHGVCWGRLSGERDFLAMAADARGLTSGDEVVWLMAADARFVAGWRRPVSLRVTRRARI
jgi:hypothetical protein